MKLGFILWIIAIGLWLIGAHPLDAFLAVIACVVIMWSLTFGE